MHHSFLLAALVLLFGAVGATRTGSLRTKALQDDESRSLFWLDFSGIEGLSRSGRTTGKVKKGGKGGKGGKGKGGGKGGKGGGKGKGGDDDDGGCGGKGKAGKGQGGRGGDDDDDDDGGGCDEDDENTNAPPMRNDTIPFEEEVESGSSIVAEFCIPTAAIPQNLEMCLLSDASSSFTDSQAVLRGVAPGIASAILASSPDAQLGYAAFIDVTDIFVYRLLQPLSTNVTAWLAAINGLSPTGGGTDIAEAQYDGIACAVDIGSCPTKSGYSTADCGFSSGSSAKKVIVVTTDAPFKRNLENNESSTLAALQDNDVVLIGLEAPGARGELDVLAAATGGTVEELASTGENIANAILAGLNSLTTLVEVDASTCTGFGVTFTSTSVEVPSGQDACFQVALEDTAGSPPGTELSCIFEFAENALTVETYSIRLTVIAI